MKKTRFNTLNFMLVLSFASTIFSCNQTSVDPALVLDEVYIPDGYHQIDNPSVDALSRLEEFRLENPEDHYYYLEREQKDVGRDRSWVFPQKELKIEYVDFEKSETLSREPKLMGLIVKKIKGNWQDEEFSVYDNHPKPDGGMKALYDYIGQNLKYPEIAKKEGIQGKVFVEFIVEKDGKISNVKAIKGIGGGCDEEAVRVLKASPIWIPADIMGMPVKVRMILPISYKLS